MDDKRPGFRTTRGYQLINQAENGLTSSMEDYLEMICRICMEDGCVRVGKLSERLQVKPSSASKMVGKLLELGYLGYDDSDNMLLTDRGSVHSAYLLERHRTIERFLEFLGNENPLEETELLEHSASSETIFQLNLLLGFFEENMEITAKYKKFAGEPISEKTRRIE